jgi:hypothetical protein
MAVDCHWKCKNSSTWIEKFRHLQMWSRLHLFMYWKICSSPKYFEIFACRWKIGNAQSINHVQHSFYERGRRGHDRMVIGFTTTYAISAYHHWRYEFKSRSGEVCSIQHYVCQWLAAGLWFSLGTSLDQLKPKLVGMFNGWSSSKFMFLFQLEMQHGCWIMFGTFNNISVISWW